MTGSGLNAADVIRMLALEPLRGEGGLYRETHRSTLDLPAVALPGGYAGPRSAGTAIYYLLTPDACSALHRVRGDEVFHFYLGDPVQMLQLRPDGRADTPVIGPDLAAGQRPQVVVPGGVWQGSRLVPGGRFALLGTTMAPGYAAEDLELGSRGDLLRRYPAHRALITDLTPGHGPGGTDP